MVTAITVSANEFVPVGDTNQDGVIGTDDAVYILQCAAGLETYSNDIPMYVGDVDFDHELSTSDAREILKMAAGISEPKTLAFYDWEIVDEPTCYSFGKAISHSLQGNYTRTEILPMKDHEMVNATCTKGAYCSECLQNFSEPTGHIESDWIIDEESNCRTMGVKHKECLDCKKTIKKSVIPATGSYIAVNNVASTRHNIQVNLSSKTITDFSNVTVSKTGKNLLDLSTIYKVYGSLNNDIIDANNNYIKLIKPGGPNSQHGISFATYLPAGVYTISTDYELTNNNNTCTLIVFASDRTICNNSAFSYSNKGIITFEITKSGEYEFAFFNSYSAEKNDIIELKNIQLEIGSEKTDFEKYTKQIIKANTDGSVFGLASVSPNMTIIANNNVEISCEYQKNISSPEIEPTKTNRIVKTIDYIDDGDIIFLESNAIKKNKTLFFNANITSLGTIILRHGKNAYGTGYLTIDERYVNVYRYSSSNILVTSIPHGLTISGETSIVAFVGSDGKLCISITSNNATFSNKVDWYGSRGNIEMETVSSIMNNLTLSWECTDYAQDIWFFGDSYFEINSTRWPYYLLQKNDNFLLSGFGGAGALQMYADFQTALSHGTPKFAVWCLGMNNGDSENGINTTWKTYTEKFIADCEANGIIPILATIPNTPTVNNVYKNEYVRNSGYRYIDFASAVGATQKGSNWYPGMLSSDNVHPAIAGGEALAKQILVDLPEINKN